MLKALGYGNIEVSILLTTDAAIRTLTARWFGRAHITDVLSFPQEERPGDAARSPRRARTGLLGDVVINLDEARRRSAETRADAPLGDTPQRPTRRRTATHADTIAEVQRLLAHGLCHLAGYDHERSPREAARMRARERTLLKAVQA